MNAGQSRRFPPGGVVFSQRRRNDEHESREMRNAAAFISRSGHVSAISDDRLNAGFTGYSRSTCMMRAFGRDIPTTGTGYMSFWSTISHYAVAIREFVAPTYRPERHYMRGPGPACARRRGGASFEARATFH
jgi:hypothetical protein